MRAIWRWFRAQKAQAVAVLAAPRPRWRRLRRAQGRKAAHAALPERVEARPLPVVTVVKRRISDELPQRPSWLGALRETLARREQAILFLNRRGHTRTLLCASCGAAVGCPNCSVALVLHRTGSERPPLPSLRARGGPARTCAGCGGTRLFAFGGGTEKVEEQLESVVPRARVGRLDRDAAGGPGQAAALLARFARRELDVLVGTQMVGEGTRLSRRDLVGVLDADGPLHLPDFRAAERCVQASHPGRRTCGARRLARARPGPGFKPDAIALDYDAFASAELRRREELHFPPFVRLVAVRLLGHSEARVRGAGRARGGASPTLHVQRRARGRARTCPSPAGQGAGQAPVATAARARDHGRSTALPARSRHPTRFAGVQLCAGRRPGSAALNRIPAARIGSGGRRTL